MLSFPLALAVEASGNKLAAALALSTVVGDDASLVGAGVALAVPVSHVELCASDVSPGISVVVEPLVADITDIVV